MNPAPPVTRALMVRRRSIARLRASARMMSHSCGLAPRSPRPSGFILGSELRDPLFGRNARRVGTFAPALLSVEDDEGPRSGDWQDVPDVVTLLQALGENAGGCRGVVNTTARPRLCRGVVNTWRRCVH